MRGDRLQGEIAAHPLGARNDRKAGRYSAVTGDPCGQRPQASGVRRQESGRAEPQAARRRQRVYFVHFVDFVCFVGRKSRKPQDWQLRGSDWLNESLVIGKTGSRDSGVQGKVEGKFPSPLIPFDILRQAQNRCSRHRSPSVGRGRLRKRVIMGLKPQGMEQDKGRTTRRG